MVPIRKIVVPFDLSRRSVEAVDYASAIAVRYESELTLLHVVEPPRFEFAMLEPPGNLLDRMVAERVEAMSAEIERFRSQHLSGTKADVRILQGQPAEAIVDYCVKQQIDLVVMPTRGRGPLRQFIIGSVAAKVLHDVPCAVLTGVHLELDFGFPKFHVNRVVCAVDLGPHSGPVVRWGADLARDFQAECTLIHVIAQEAHAQNARRRLRQLLQSASVDADIVIKTGEPEKEITQAAAGLGADLIVIGRGTSEGLLGRLRAQSYAIVRGARCPVLSV